MKIHFGLLNVNMQEMFLIKVARSLRYEEKNDAEQQLEQSNKLQHHIRKYFYVFDGMRCYEHANVIAEFIKKSSDESMYYGEFLVKNPKRILPYLREELKWFLSRTKGFIVDQLLNRHIFKAVTFEEDLENTLVDSSGHYDKRIKDGDERYWFKKFEGIEICLRDFETMLSKTGGNK